MKPAELVCSKKEVGIPGSTDQPAFQEAKDLKRDENIIKHEEEGEKIKCEEPKNGLDTPMAERGGGDSLLDKAEGDNSTTVPGQCSSQ